MKFSTKDRYALLLMVELASATPGEYLPLKAVSDNQGISVKYLEQIFMALRKGGMIRSIKGPQGGYLLAKKPGEILLSEVIRLLDGDYLLEKEFLGDGENLASKIIQEKIIDPANCWVSEFLEHLTLQNLVDAYEQELASSQDMYYI